MRAKNCSALLTIGLICATLAKAGEGAPPSPVGPTMELVIDTALHPTERRFTSPSRVDAVWDHAKLTSFGSDGVSGLDFALSSPGILFGAPHDFLTLSMRLHYPATTAVVFPDFAR